MLVVPGNELNRELVSSRVRVQSSARRQIRIVVEEGGNPVGEFRKVPLCGKQGHTGTLARAGQDR